MRRAFVETLCSLAAEDERIVLLTGDLGYMALEPFRDRFPRRFFNAGVAEQNMVGLATGLAESGFRPYVYSIATFASLRPLEFIRNGPVAHRLAVRIVGIGAGFEYGHGGFSHYALEDIAIMRALAGITVVVPADSEQTKSALRRTHALPGPVYYSLGKDEREPVDGLNGAFELSRLEVLRRGGLVTIVAMGALSQEAMRAAKELERRSIETTVAIVSSFNPDPEADMVKLLAGTRHVVSVEAQTVSGGLGAFVASVIAAHGLPCRLCRLAVHRLSDGTSGAQPNRWRQHGLDRTAICEAVISMLGVSEQ